MKVFRIKVACRSIAHFWLLSYCASIVFPTVTFALTSGPSQPEVQAFTPASASNMVDLFSGDFKYNIPLMEVGGYPLNLAYSANISAEEEASWVGLGWSLNPGAVTRNLRGLPDDFSGDQVVKEYNVKPNRTFGVGISVKPEIFGFSLGEFVGGGIGLGKGVFYNNYTGLGSELSVSVGLSAGQKGKSGKTFNLGLNVAANSEKGLDVGLNACFDDKIDKDDKATAEGSVGVSLGYNSRSGLKQLSFDKSLGGNNVTSSSNIARFSFAKPTYTPEIKMPMSSYSGSASVDFGTSVYGTDIMFGAKGYYSEQRLSNGSRTMDGYGYLYSHQANSQNTLYDLNREKDGNFTQGMKNLPLTNFTYDIFNVDVQGCNGSFRAHRGDVGIVSDPVTKSPSFGIDITGPEIAAAISGHVGVDIKGNADYSTTGRWNTAIDQAYAFRKIDSTKDFEPYYFKKTGDLGVDNDYSWFMNDLGGFQATSLQVIKSGSAQASVSLDQGILSPGLDLNNTMDLALPVNHRNSRNNRNTRGDLFYFLNAEEASKAGVLKTIPTYSLNGFGDAKVVSQNLRTSYPKHHISEVSVVKTDGKRYVFGVPAYNTLHEEMTFNVSSPDATGKKDGLVTYTANDATAGNDKGLDHYFTKTTTPAYAHSFMLSSILSHDYKDVDAVEGPSDGDLGTYVKLNHTKAIEGYKWRTPAASAVNIASYNEFLKTDSDDDKGSVVYGEKDVWYVHSIETPTQLAEFYISKRADGGDVADRAGGQGNNYLYKLDSIKLFDKSNRLKNPGAEAVKTVHFVYDYTLCPNTPNTNATLNPNGGKLTLKSVFFTYQNSKKGAFNPYVFHYPTNESEGNYSYAAHTGDRWGVYKPNTSELPNSEFPYVNQDALASKYASAWAMTDIDLPTGGTIHIQYEADDYAYVQNRRAMQMFKVIGAGTAVGDNPVNLLYDGLQLGTDGSVVSLANKDYLFFEIPDMYQTAISSKMGSTQGMDTLRNLFFGDDQLVYFKFDINVKKGDPNGNTKESVPGYFTFDKANSGVVSKAGKLVGYVKLKQVDMTGIGGINVTPITKAAVQFTRINIPREFYNQPNVHENGFIAVIKELVGINDFKNLINASVAALNAENLIMLAAGAGSTFDTGGHSVIRLFNPIGAKLGGGHRVKKITIADNWHQMVNKENDFSYGQEYTYTTLGADNKTLISSGVAAYEPFIGEEENPFRQPVYYDVDKLLAPSERYYHEEPFGESFFPAPSVGYSKVTVKSLQYANVRSNATGYIVNEFYTAKDFPVFTQRTGLNLVKTSPALQALSFLKISADDITTVTQGYYIELNDMHGKAKAVYAYPQDGKSFVSGTEYRYQQNKVQLPVEIGTGSTVTYTFNRLNNEVKTLNKQAYNNSHELTQQVVGVDYDMVHDFRSNVSNLSSAGALVNVDWFIIGIFPIIVPVVLPTIDHEHTEFNSAVTTKVVHRSGVMESVTQYDQGSSVTVYNRSFDPNLGDALLTKTQNQYNDSTFSFSYPAYWAYGGMEPAFQNVGRVYAHVNFNSGTTAVFNEGDELLITKGSVSRKATVLTRYGTTYMVAYNDANEYVGNNIDQVKVLHSGRKNMLTERGGTVTTLAPLTIDNQIGFKNILNAGAMTYKNIWAQYCECNVGGSPNPSIRDSNRAYYPEASYVYVTERVLTRTNDNPNLKTDGTYADFMPFWWYSPQSLQWYPVSSHGRWLPNQAVTVRNGHGEELENRDYLGRFSAAMFGYAQTLPTALATNTPYSSLGFDNFETYEVENCEDNHFNFKKGINTSPVITATPSLYQSTNNYTDLSSGPTITGAESHTGRYSIKVPNGSQAAITKTITLCPPKKPTPPREEVVK